MADTGPVRQSLVAPLKKPAFAALWVAGIVSGIGTAMQTVAATWTVMSLDPSPGMVAAMQAAASAPLFLVGLPAGVLADIVDRRLLLITANAWMAVTAAILAVVAGANAAGVIVMIGATFAIGLGAAAAAPAVQAIVPELAEGPLLAPAVALNSIGMNVARTIGPALGGLALAAIGAPWVFGLNALSTVAVIAALAFWRRKPTVRRLPPEHFVSATRASLRYVAFAPDVRRVLGQAAAFFLFASAPWALLPLVASNQLALGASGYGTLLGALGMGAVVTALVLGRLQAALGTAKLSALATAACASCSVVLGLVSSEWQALAALALFGGGWITVLTILNVGVQTSVAGWIRARMLAIYVVVYFGTFAAGSVLWGQVATLVGVPSALAGAAVLGLVAAASFLLLPHKSTDPADLASAAAAEPTLVADARGMGGAVLVSTDYSIPARDAARFGEALWALRAARRRNGALSWRHWRDPSDPGFHRESFVVESWTEYQRQTVRQTVGDQTLEQAVAAIAKSDGATRIMAEHAAIKATYPKPCFPR